jgi:predicted RNA binding protein YcfA (HicA-like mRNA interferase family)
MSRSSKIREIQAELRALGARRLRCRGSHECWRLPSGALVVLKVSHPGAPASRVVRGALSRAIRRELASRREGTKR